MRVAPVVTGLAALGAFLAGYLGRHYPWPLAFVTGITVGAFVHAASRTLVRMREQLRPREDLAFDWSAGGASAPAAPGEEGDGAGQEGVHPGPAEDAGEEQAEPGREEAAREGQP